jgi:hypothetical protein
MALAKDSLRRHPSPTSPRRDAMMSWGERWVYIVRGTRAGRIRSRESRQVRGRPICQLAVAIADSSCGSLQRPIDFGGRRWTYQSWAHMAAKEYAWWARRCPGARAWSGSKQPSRHGVSQSVAKKQGRRFCQGDPHGSEWGVFQAAR